MKRPAWTCRSQRSVLKQAELEKRLRQCELCESLAKKWVAEFERRRETQLNLASQGDGLAVSNLKDTVLRLQENKAEVAAYEGLSASLRSEIEALERPGRSILARRRKAQDEFAKLALERLKKDQQLDRALQSLGALLGERTALTAKMREAAEAVELAIDVRDGLDEDRFNVLSGSLPCGLAETSEARTAWLLGKKQSTKPYIVRKETVLPETLVSHEIYRTGERVDLPEWLGSKHPEFFSPAEQEGPPAIESQAAAQDPPQREFHPHGSVEALRAGAGASRRTIRAFPEAEVARVLE